MRVLIVTIPGDAHAHAVSWGLEQLGHTAVLWYPADLAGGATWTFDPTSQMLSINYRDQFETFCLDEFDSVWLRRVPLIIPLPNIESSQERAAAETEMMHFVAGICRSLENGKLCVNPISNTWGADRKVYQLSLANKLGFKTPKTVVTNRFDSLRDFHAQQSAGTIWKPLQAFVWMRGDGNAMIPATTAIKSMDIFEGADIENSPAIYQELIEKITEVRVIVMGKSVFGFETSPQHGNFDQVDWRFEHGPSAKHSLHKLPNEVSTACLQLMDSLGLLYAAIDLAVDKDGEYVFFEINPGGQFLYGEDLVPDAPLLDAFCRFLASGNAGFIYSENANPIRFSNFLAEVDFDGDVKVEADRHFGMLAKYHFARISVPMLPQT